MREANLNQLHQPSYDVRPARASEAGRLFEIWSTAIDATHHFLTTEDRHEIAGKVHEYVEQFRLLVAVDEDDVPLGFMGLSEERIDSLFVHSHWHSRGVGRALVAYAKIQFMRLKVDVNEQNIQAIGFYLSQGFATVDRSPCDDEGRPYPLLHMELASPGTHFSLDPKDARIRAARPEDAPACQAIEDSAGMKFEEIDALRHLTEGAGQPLSRYRQWLRSEWSWMLFDGSDRPIGFLCADAEGPVVHWWELGISRSHQGRGLGRMLISHAIEDARSRGMAAISLTTFRDVAWNAPTYARVGFRILPPLDLGDRLEQIVEHEDLQGLDRNLRCAMLFDLMAVASESENA